MDIRELLIFAVKSAISDEEVNIIGGRDAFEHPMNTKNKTMNTRAIDLRDLTIRYPAAKKQKAAVNRVI